MVASPVSKGSLYVCVNNDHAQTGICIDALPILPIRESVYTTLTRFALEPDARVSIQLERRQPQRRQPARSFYRQRVATR